MQINNPNSTITQISLNLDHKKQKKTFFTFCLVWLLCVPFYNF